MRTTPLSYQSRVAFSFIQTATNYFSAAKHRKRTSSRTPRRKSRCSGWVLLWKHVRNASGRSQVRAALQLWPRATFVLRGCSGHASEGIRTTGHKSYRKARRPLFPRVWSFCTLLPVIKYGCRARARARVTGLGPLATRRSPGVNMLGTRRKMLPVTGSSFHSNLRCLEQVALISSQWRLSLEQQMRLRQTQTQAGARF